MGSKPSYRPGSFRERLFTLVSLGDRIGLRLGMPLLTIVVQGDTRLRPPSEAMASVRGSEICRLPGTPELENCQALSDQTAGGGAKRLSQA